MAQISIVGNLTADPRLITNGKTPRTIFTIAENEQPREEGGEERSHFLQCTAWGTLAENLAASLSKGTRVVAVGRVNTYSKDVEIDGDDVALTMTSFTVSAIGPDLRWAQSEVTKVQPKARRAEPDDTDAETETRQAKPAPRRPATKSRATAQATSRTAAVEEEDDEF